MGRQAQVHNSTPGAKEQIRRALIAELGGVGAVSVLETHSGPGVMRARCYDGAGDWLGVDKDPSSPDAIHADSCDVMRAIDVGRFNLFDVDAFGSPWEHVWIISQRRRIADGETVALAITNGLAAGGGAMSAVAYGHSRQVEEAIGLPYRTPNKWLISKRSGENYAQRLVGAWFGAGKIVRWISAQSKRRVWYFGVLLKG